jgi:hypothetical protein
MKGYVFNTTDEFDLDLEHWIDKALDFNKNLD